MLSVTFVDPFALLGTNKLRSTLHRVNHVTNVMDYIKLITGVNY